MTKIEDTVSKEAGFLVAQGWTIESYDSTTNKLVATYEKPDVARIKLEFNAGNLAKAVNKDYNAMIDESENFVLELMHMSDEQRNRELNAYKVMQNLADKIASSDTINDEEKAIRILRMGGWHIERNEDPSGYNLWYDNEQYMVFLSGSDFARALNSKVEDVMDNARNMLLELIYEDYPLKSVQLIFEAYDILSNMNMMEEF